MISNTYSQRNGKEDMNLALLNGDMFYGEIFSYFALVSRKIAFEHVYKYDKINI